MPLRAALFVGALSILPGCGATREVEVEGTVVTPASADDQRPIALEFYDLRDDGWRLAKFGNLDRPGDFRATVSAQGDKIRVVAVDDTDFSGECTPGEAWGSGSAAIRDDDTTPHIEVDLAEQRSCPSAGD